MCASMTGNMNFPPQLTAFVGRQAELAAIAERLADPACRLLTLVGAGGVGKTRLALQAANRAVNDFGDGVYFVNLQPVRSPDFLMSAVSDALDLTLSGQQSPQAQVLNYLSDREALLVLDNFERLTEAADLVAIMLQAAPRLKLMVTSQVELNLQGEWLYPVAGMPFPGTGETAEIADYDAVQFFVACARRVRPDFSLAAEAEGVVRVCRLVDGVPLAIELAASWTRTLHSSEIAAEIEKNIDFLATSSHDVPDRHRNMEAVFHHSWALLTPAEQAVFKRLSVFRGGFQREAAEQVAGASLPLLSRLVRKSLLRWQPCHSQEVPYGRYQIHELLRQYAETQLSTLDEDVTESYERHCAYYLDFLQRRWDDMLGGRQRQATAEIATELENVRAAWAWAVKHDHAQSIHRALVALDSFYQFQSHYLEGARVMEKATRDLGDTEANQPVLADLLVSLGWFYIRLGQFPEAEAVLERSRSIYDAHDIKVLPGMGLHPLLPLAVLALIRGDFTEAADLAGQARRLLQGWADEGNIAVTHYVLASVSLAQGDTEAAYHHTQRACRLAESADNRWFLAYCLNESGRVARAMARYQEAQQHYQASYDIRHEFRDPEGMAAALVHLGEIAMLQANYQDGKEQYQRALELYRQISDKGGLAGALAGLGNAAVALDDYQMARQQFQDALQIAVEIQYLPLLLDILIGIGELLLQVGEAKWGIGLLALVAHHPASEHETKAKAQNKLRHHEDSLSQEQMVGAVQEGEAGDLDTTIAAVEAKLAVLEVPTESAVAETGDNAAMADSLVNPLTPREMEVLQHIAQGKSNRQIAETLVLSTGTIKWYTSEIYSKLYVNSRTQAVARARELKLLDFGGTP